MQSRSTCHVPCRRRLALAGTLQTQISAPPPPSPPSPACHTFDLAAGGLRNPRSSSAAQPLWSTCCCCCCKARRLVVNTYCAKCPCPRPYPHPHPHPHPHARPAPAPPRLASCFPWRHGALPIYLYPAHRPPPAPSSVRWPSPHSPAQRSLSEKGPRRANARQVCCDTRILMLVCPASAESLSQTYPCAWRTMALALSVADASPEYQVFPVLSLIPILLMLLAACSLLCAACGLLAHNTLASPIDLVDISPLRPPIVSLPSQ